MEEIRRLFIINDKGHLSKKNFNEDLFKERFPDIWVKIVGFSETHLVWKEKVFRYINNIIETPKCACGCGNEVTFGKANNYHYFKYNKYYSPTCYTGENNPFFGRNHTKQSRDKASATKTGIPAHPNTVEKSRQRMLDNNPMHKMGMFEWFVSKYGKEEAERMWEEKRERDRQNMTGKNNPMYGRSPSKQAGRSLKFWYKGLFLRSLHELSFVVNYCERFDLTFRSAETLEFRIKTDSWTYRPDFFVSEKFVVEIKPKALHRINKWKFDYVREEFFKQGYIFKVIDPIKKMKYNDLFPLVKSGELILQETRQKSYSNFMEKYNKWLCGQ